MKRMAFSLALILLSTLGAFPQAKKTAPAQSAAPAAAPAPAISLAELKTMQAVLQTSLGEIVIEFYPDKAPNHVKYFASLVKSGFYNGTTFHHMLLGGFIQGGDPYTKDPAKKAQYGTGGLNKLKAEFNDNKLLRGTVAAVLQPPNPDSAGSQFFICVSPQPQLDGQLTVWGHVVEGIEVVDSISAAPTDSNMMAKDRVEIFKAFLRPIPPPQPIPFADATPDQMKKYHVILETSMGEIEIELFPDSAPEHVRNFLRLSQTGLYDSTLWHRVVEGFVIQGGDLGTRTPPVTQIQRDKFVKNLMVEISSRKHERGTVSMARAEALDSATTSFFICLSAQPALDGNYTVFGNVVRGLDVVDKIGNVPTENEKPKTRVDLLHAKVFEVKLTP